MKELTNDHVFFAGKQIW